MVRQLRSEDDWKLAVLNELSRIATSLEELQYTQEYALIQKKQATIRMDIARITEESE